MMEFALEGHRIISEHEKTESFNGYRAQNKQSFY